MRNPFFHDSSQEKLVIRLMQYCDSSQEQVVIQLKHDRENQHS